MGQGLAQLRLICEQHGDHLHGADGQPETPDHVGSGQGQSSPPPWVTPGQWGGHHGWPGFGCFCLGGTSRSPMCLCVWMHVAFCVQTQGVCHVQAGGFRFPLCEHQSSWSPSPTPSLHINLKYERMLGACLCWLLLRLQQPCPLPPALLSKAACHCNFMVHITDSSPPLNQSNSTEYVKGIQAFWKEPAS